MYDGTRGNGRRGQAHRGGKRADGRERVRLGQLLVCLALFLVVFLGRGIFPDRLAELGGRVRRAISADTDFAAVFSQLGETLADHDSVVGELGDFCVQVFGPQDNKAQQTGGGECPPIADLLDRESRFLTQRPDGQKLARHYLSAENGQMVVTLGTRQVERAQPADAPEPEHQAIPAAGTVVAKSDYSGQPLPQNYTMDRLSLGELDTVTPVLGRINSAYGYRDHPINGVYQFHGGVDIGGQMGDPIAAFAAGTVEYVGRDDSYGLYLQLDHGNGVKSFYAHCSSLCVKKGQTVAKGEKIGQVGSSGAATGPHLHLELKYGKTHVDPIYYIQYRSAA